MRFPDACIHALPGNSQILTDLDGLRVQSGFALGSAMRPTEPVYCTGAPGHWPAPYQQAGPLTAGAPPQMRAAGAGPIPSANSSCPAIDPATAALSHMAPPPWPAVAAAPMAVETSRRSAAGAPGGAGVRAQPVAVNAVASAPQCAGTVRAGPVLAGAVLPGTVLASAIRPPVAARAFGNTPLHLQPGSQGVGARTLPPANAIGQPGVVRASVAPVATAAASGAGSVSAQPVSAESIRPPPKRMLSEGSQLKALPDAKHGRE